MSSPTISFRVRMGLVITFALFASHCTTNGVDGSTDFESCQPDTECPPEPSCSEGSPCLPSGLQDSGQTSSNTCKPARAINILQAPLPADDAYANIKSDGQSVYFAGVSSLYRVPISGGVAEALYSGSFAGQFGAAAGTVAWVPLTAATLAPAGLTIQNADGVHAAVLPNGVLPSPSSSIVVDTNGSVFFEVDLPSGGRSHTWRWDPSTGSAAEMPGVGMPDAGAGTNLYWADRGDLLWSNNMEGAAGGLYLTDISTGSPRQIVDTSAVGFGGLVGLDEKNVYGTGGICPKGACLFTVYGVERSGGTPFVAYESAEAYWVSSPPQADDTGLYWMDWSTSSIYHAAATIGAVASPVVQMGSSPPAIGSTLPADFAMDACNVYWLQIDSSRNLHVMASSK